MKSVFFFLEKRKQKQKQRDGNLKLNRKHYQNPRQRRKKLDVSRVSASFKIYKHDYRI